MAENGCFIKKQAVFRVRPIWGIEVIFFGAESPKVNNQS